MFVFAAYGPAVIDHSLLVSGFSLNSKIGKDIDAERGLLV